MSFQQLKVDELKDVAQFFVVDVEVADEEHGPTKKELLAALASEEVSWDDYKDTYVPAKEAGTDKSKEQKREEAAAKEPVAGADPDEDVVPEPVDQSDWILVKYERANPTYQVGEFTFYKDHPYLAVPEEVAENLVTSGEGFRIALPREVADYYN